MNIATILQTQATTHPRLPAIIDTYRGRSRTTSFAKLEVSAGRAASLLKQSGLQPGDTVLLFHPMSAELYIILAALFRLGLVAMFLDPSAGKDHIQRCCALYPPKALIASTKAHLLRLCSPALRHIPLKFAIGFPVPGAVSWKLSSRRSAEGGSASLSPDSQIFPCTPDTPALVTFTSGSTGRPKAALRTHGFLKAQHRVLVGTLELKPGEVDLATLPIFVLANLASGLTTLIPNVDLRFPGAISARTVLASIHANQPLRTVASPAFLERLAQYCQERGLTLPSFEKIFIGGGPVMPRAITQLQQIAPQAKLTIVYGSTEAEPIAHISHDSIQPEDIAATLQGHGLLVGTPVSAIKLKILRQQWGNPVGPMSHTEFSAACLPPGEAGEIVVSGNHVLPGYLSGYGNEETKFSVNGTPWHRTGDAGYLDLQGRLWLLGSCLGRIEDVHGTLYPLAAEAVAAHHPGIRRAALVCHRGQRILAVELNKPRSEVNLATLRASLASMHIQRIKVYRKLPLDKRHNAKIDYPALLKLVAE